MGTILVTGGAGFIGSNFVRHALARTDDRVVVLDKLTYAGNLESLADVASHPRYAFAQADIADREAVRALFREHRPDAVVNFAAETHVDRSIDDPAAFVRTNATGTFELLEAARLFLRESPDAAAAFRFLHVSTDEVYGTLGASGRFSEETPYAPNSPYAASKAGADHPAGLIPTLSAVRSGKTIGLANKEALVMAGRILISESKNYRSKIIPVDSEHSAIFQCIEGHRKAALRSIILTASGGPFAGRSPPDMVDITPEDALKHPRWKMGKKITIDSATLMNKGFEVIGAHHLLGLPHESIDVVIHPQSIVHSIVEFRDRSCIAQLSVPDMKGPIAYALTYPQRIDNVMDGLSLHEIGTLTFKKPKNVSFPCLSYAYSGIRGRGNHAVCTQCCK